MANSSSHTQYHYNRDRELQRIERQGQPDIVFTRSAQGQLQRIQAGSLSLNYQYDRLGRLERLQSPEETVEPSYDGSRLTQVKLSGLMDVSLIYSYDDLGRLIRRTIQTATQSHNEDYSYRYLLGDRWVEGDGRITQVGDIQFNYFPSATSTHYKNTKIGHSADLNSMGQLSVFANFYPSIEAGDIFGSGIKNNKYVLRYNEAGQIKQKQHNVHKVGLRTDVVSPDWTLDYQYDAQGRLTQVSNDGGVLESYHYDSNGNRQAEDESAQVDAQDRLTSCGQRQYEYDALGRTTASHQCGQSTTYHYNDFGQMDQVSLPNGDQLTYHYNAQGQRAGKDRNGKPEWRLLYEGPRAIARIGADGKILDVYHYALQAHSPDFMSRDGHTYQFIKDYLGTVTEVIDVDAAQQGQASLSQSKTYDSWGWVQSDSSPGFQPFGYAGGIEDPDTHLTRFGARDYHAIEGRWLSKDPIGFAGGDSNLYGYVGGDPVNGVDPSGLIKNFSVIGGYGFSLVPVYGIEGSAGLYFNPGLAGGKADAGAFAAGGQGVGLNMGVSGYLGFVSGEATNIDSPFTNINVSTAWISFTLMFEPDKPPSWETFGGAAIGPAAKAGASIMNTDAGKISILDLIKKYHLSQCQ